MNDREDILLWSGKVAAKKLHAREMRQGMPSTPASTRLFGRTLDDATNSYKFFWLQALFSVIGRQHELVIPVRTVASSGANVPSGAAVTALRTSATEAAGRTPEAVCNCRTACYSMSCNPSDNR
jgi:hypothetical protein